MKSDPQLSGGKLEPHGEKGTVKLEEEDRYTVAKEGERADDGGMAEDGFVPALVPVSRFYFVGGMKGWI